MVVTGAVAAVVALAAAITVALDTRARASAASGSYCDAARAVTQYRGGDVERFHALIDRAAARAPREIRATIRTLRAVAPGSHGFTAARATLIRFDTETCCTCIGGHSAPVVVSDPAASP